MGGKFVPLGRHDYYWSNFIFVGKYSRNDLTCFRILMISTCLVNIEENILLVLGYLWFQRDGGFRRNHRFRDDDQHSKNVNRKWKHVSLWFSHRCGCRKFLINISQHICCWTKENYDQQMQKPNKKWKPVIISVLSICYGYLYSVIHLMWSLWDKEKLKTLTEW